LFIDHGKNVLGICCSIEETETETILYSLIALDEAGAKSAKVLGW